MKAFLCLGTAAEVIGILPIVQHEFETAGKKPTLVVGMGGTDLGLEQPFCHIGHSVQDFPTTLGYAKRQFSEVIAFPSRNDPIMEHRHPSFQFDQWDRAGVLHLWNKLPLTLPRYEDQHDFVRGWFSGMGCKKVTPFILVCASDKERPYPFKAELIAKLSEDFQNHKVIDLVRELKFMEALALYDAADLIVCAETVHLQLTRATKTRVIALANDKPSPWHGSAPHPRFKWYGHYGSVVQLTPAK